MPVVPHTRWSDGGTTLDWNADYFPTDRCWPWRCAPWVSRTARGDRPRGAGRRGSGRGAAAGGRREDGPASGRRPPGGRARRPGRCRRPPRPDTRPGPPRPPPAGDSSRSPNRRTARFPGPEVRARCAHAREPRSGDGRSPPKPGHRARRQRARTRSAPARAVPVDGAAPARPARTRLRGPAGAAARARPPGRAAGHGRVSVEARAGRAPGPAQGPGRGPGTGGPGWRSVTPRTAPTRPHRPGASRNTCTRARAHACTRDVTVCQPRRAPRPGRDPGRPGGAPGRPAHRPPRRTTVPSSGRTVVADRGR